MAIFQAKEGILSQSADTLKKELLEVLKKEQVLSKQVVFACRCVVLSYADWYPILGVLCHKWGGNSTAYTSPQWKRLD